MTLASKPYTRPATGSAPEDFSIEAVFSYAAMFHFMIRILWSEVIPWEDDTISSWLENSGPEKTWIDESLLSDLICPWFVPWRSRPKSWPKTAVTSVDSNVPWGVEDTISSWLENSGPEKTWIDEFLLSDLICPWFVPWRSRPKSRPKTTVTSVDSNRIFIVFAFGLSSFFVSFVIVLMIKD